MIHSSRKLSSVLLIVLLMVPGSGLAQAKPLEVRWNGPAPWMAISNTASQIRSQPLIYRAAANREAIACACNPPGGPVLSSAFCSVPQFACETSGPASRIAPEISLRVPSPIHFPPNPSTGGAGCRYFTAAYTAATARSVNTNLGNSQTVYGLA
jgi:hypothetical protein